ncbi:MULTISPECIES: GNAT family N-acetyltransferase [unclassified Janthinobacterium]|uniref:GNAT family N-acetyltransferase n=1 Tax=unclassified Janthinobacterium TaxID=2610881 RepID=UPI001E6492D8|nr:MULTISPECIES: GNAT family N-acetyltransferase [unclassified Janthinobacterium]MCC7643455.1 GNAT family N-acetyltransferase [Janthinobacterium sp. EB271-G4-3-1]MCC7693660.1 GNAT family N-acetyltransferase [Janthinobacterium sp. EB271-G4-3-2]
MSRALHTESSRTARSLAAALIGDPFYRAVTVACGEDEAARLAMLEAYFALALAEGEQAGRVDLADAVGNGAAIWTTDTPAARRQAAYAQREDALRVLLGEQGYAHFTAIVGNMEHALAPHGLQDAWYLSIAGIHPDVQGRGLGASVLAPGLAAVDAAGAACFLETYNERSLPFYARLGFVVAGRYAEAVTGCDYWLMVRPPHAA